MSRDSPKQPSRFLLKQDIMHGINRTIETAKLLHPKSELRQAMYLCRLALIVTVLLAAYVAALVMLIVPHLWLAIAAILIALAFRKVTHLSAHGTARWAEVGDLDQAQMLEGQGLILG